MERQRELLRGQKSGDLSSHRTEKCLPALPAMGKQRQNSLMISQIQAVAVISKGMSVLPESGPLQDIGVLHQLFLVIPSAPDGTESTLLLLACHTDQADHRGSQEEDQGHQEQPHQDHR